MVDSTFIASVHPQKSAEDSQKSSAPTGWFPPLSQTALADAIVRVIDDHEVATALMLSRYLDRPIGTVRNTLTALCLVHKLVSVPTGRKEAAYARKIPKTVKPNIAHALGIAMGDLALAYCEERCGFTILASDLKLKHMPDRQWRLLRPQDTEGVLMFREFQRTQLTKRQLREKMTPYMAMDHHGKRLLIETETRHDVEKYLHDLATFLFPHEWLRRIWLTSLEDYQGSFLRYVEPIWRNVDGKAQSILGNWNWRA